MVKPPPAKSPTSTELSALKPWGTLWAQVALILVALLVALPSPIAALWGGRRSGSPWLAIVATSAWIALTAILWRLAQKRHAQERSSEALSAALLITDVLGLTVLLSASGAAQNPFTMLYFVPITQATFIARPWTFRIALLSVSGFALLLLQTQRTLAPHLGHPHHAHFFDHVQGMAIALAVAGLFITAFVRRMALELKQRQEAIKRLSRQQDQDRIAVALGALSAGAGHELGTPLGSVQLLAEELPHLEGNDRDEALATIVSEVQRMKSIVHSMLTSELSADALKGGSAWSLDVLVKEFEDERITIELDAPFKTKQARSVLTQILKELIRNAKQASADSTIHLSLLSNETTLTLKVTDNGPGLSDSELSRVTEPFVSSKGSTGLGLFLVSVHAQQLGGQLTLTSEPLKETCAQLSLPLTPPAAYPGMDSPHDS